VEGYPEEENTWVDKIDVHKDPIKEYKSANVLEP